MQDGGFISGDRSAWRNADTGGADRIVRSDGNWDSRVHNLSDSSDKRDLRQFFIRPDLFVVLRNDEPATFRPELQISDNVFRQHLNLRVVNRGKGVATDCVAKFRIVGWAENTRKPSTDSNLLRWVDGSTSKTIYPRGEEEMLNVVFADSDLQARVNQGDLDILALVATNEAYQDRQHRAQDGFGPGEFIADVTIKSKEGANCVVNLYIHTDANHRNITMRPSRWDQIIMLYKERPSIIRLISSELRYRFH